jgi:hypothetical protein
MLPTEFSGMSWLRSQIADVMSSVAAAAEEWQPDIILANQLAYGQVNMMNLSSGMIRAAVKSLWMCACKVPACDACWLEAVTVLPPAVCANMHHKQP